MRIIKSIKLVSYGFMRKGSKVLMTLIQCSSTAEGSTSQSRREAANKVSLWICASWPTIPVTMVQAGKKKTQMLCLFLSLKSNTITQYFKLAGEEILFSSMCIR